MIAMLIFQLWGTPIHCTSDRPCQLIIFPIEKSLHEFFFSNISGARIFFFVCFPSPPPPITFLMVRPLGVDFHLAEFWECFLCFPSARIFVFVCTNLFFPHQNNPNKCCKCFNLGKFQNWRIHFGVLKILEAKSGFIINCANVLWLKIFIRYKLSKTADWQSKSCNKYF
jgi:hypothetical protein